MAKGSGAGKYPPKKTFGANLKMTAKGRQQGKISATLSKQGGGGIAMGTTSKVKS